MQLMKSGDGGFMHVYSESDAVKLEGLGWTRAKEGEQAGIVEIEAPVVTEEPAEVIEEVIEEPAAEGADPVVAPKRKPGRPKGS